MATDFGRFSTYRAGLWIAQLAAKQLFLALAMTDPFIGDPLAAELIGGTYVRQPASFALAGAAALELNAPVTFTGIAPNSSIAGVMVMDARYSGNMESAYVFGVPTYLVDGGKYIVPAGDYTMGLDIAQV